MAVLVAEFELKIPKEDLVVAEVLGRETSFHSVLSAATILVSASILSNDILHAPHYAVKYVC
jgi:hypothetical protein